LEGFIETGCSEIEEESHCCVTVVDFGIVPPKTNFTAETYLLFASTEDKLPSDCQAMYLAEATISNMLGGGILHGPMSDCL
jgi:hypothetical protein